MLGEGARCARCGLLHVLNNSMQLPLAPLWPEALYPIALVECWPNGCPGPLLLRSTCPACSGRVIRAELRGELVAAKEMEIGRALELQQAFIAEAQQVRLAAELPCWWWWWWWEGRGKVLLAASRAKWSHQ